MPCHPALGPMPCRRCVSRFPLTVSTTSSTRCLATTARQTGEVFGRSHARAIQSASLAVGLIGQGLALARGRLTKHAVKQVDRLLSNQGIDVDALLVHWVPYVVGKRDSITVAMDWTEFDADGQATIMLSLLSRHGRATPLVC